MKNLVKEILCAVALTVFPMATVQAAVPYQLPDLTVCDAKADCAIILDREGYLRDSASHKKIFEQPLSKTVSNSYLLLRSGKHYIVERSNTISSKNWDSLLLTYVSGSAHAERAISLSRGFAMKTPEIYWLGYECRGDALMEQQYSPFDAAQMALCGGRRQPEFRDEGKSAITQVARKRGLVVAIPVYGPTSKQDAVYFFPGADEPDAGALLCLKNCKSGSESFGRYGGWVDKDLWIDGVLHNTEKPYEVTGSYVYVGKGERIDLVGKYLRGRLYLRESPPAVKQNSEGSATFEGSGLRDAFVGKWNSFTSGKTHGFFIASRIY